LGLPGHGEFTFEGEDKYSGAIDVTAEWMTMKINLSGRNPAREAEPRSGVARAAGAYHVLVTVVAYLLQVILLSVRPPVPPFDGYEQYGMQ
jgi:hypothetical protein